MCKAEGAVLCHEAWARPAAASCRTPTGPAERAGLPAVSGILRSGGPVANEVVAAARPDIRGVAVMLVMNWVAAPVTEALFGGGRFVTDLPGIIGWGTWTVAHLMFGAVLGLWPALRPAQAAAR